MQWDIFRTLFVEGKVEGELVDGESATARRAGCSSSAIPSRRSTASATPTCTPTSRHGARWWTAAAAQVALLDNYRSTPPLIDACNRIFESGFFSGDLARLPTPARPGGETASSRRDAAGADLDAGGGGGATPEGKPCRRIGDARAAFASWIADEAQRLVADGVTLRRRRHASGRSRYARPDGARPHRRRRPRGRRRRCAAPPCRTSSYGQEGLLATPEAEHVRRLLAARGGARRRLGAPARLAHPVLRRAARRPRRLPRAARDASARRAAARLGGARRARGATPRSSASVLRDSGLVRRLLATRQGERELHRTTSTCSTCCSRRQRGRPPRLGELAARLALVDRRHQRAPRRRRATCSGSSRCATPCRCSPCTRPRGSRRRWCSSPASAARRRSGESLRVYHLDGERRLHLGKDPVGEVAAAIEAEEAEEIERLYYVALTRARARLYLPDASQQALAVAAGRGPAGEAARRSGRRAFGWRRSSARPRGRGAGWAGAAVAARPRAARGAGGAVAPARCAAATPAGCSPPTRVCGASRPVAAAAAEDGAIVADVAS